MLTIATFRVCRGISSTLLDALTVSQCFLLCDFFKVITGTEPEAATLILDDTAAVWDVVVLGTRTGLGTGAGTGTGMGAGMGTGGGMASPGREKEGALIGTEEGSDVGRDVEAGTRGWTDGGTLGVANGTTAAVQAGTETEARIGMWVEVIG